LIRPPNCQPPPVKSIGLSRVMTLMTAPRALEPYSTELGPNTTSTRSIVSGSIFPYMSSEPNPPSPQRVLSVLPSTRVSRLKPAKPRMMGSVVL
jgi:hypothetical protein